jgi:hypothetical protein
MDTLCTILKSPKEKLEPILNKMIKDGLIIKIKDKYRVE